MANAGIPEAMLEACLAQMLLASSAKASSELRTRTVHLQSPQFHDMSSKGFNMVMLAWDSKKYPPSPPLPAEGQTSDKSGGIHYSNAWFATSVGSVARWMSP